MNDRAASLARQHTWAWLGLCAALALHVTDEATAGSLDMYNRVALAMRNRMPWLHLPPLDFTTRMLLLALAVLVLFALTPAIRRGVRTMVLFCLPWGILLTADGLYHIGLAMRRSHSVPGLRTAPLVTAAALWLLVAAHRRWHARRLSGSGAPVS